MLKKKILIIDDEKDFTDMIKLNLEATGEFTVKTLNKPSDAVTAARRFKPNLILLDVMMPHVDGGTVLYNLQKEEDLAGIPLAFLTAIVDKTETNELGDYISGRPCLSKPVDTWELISFIRTHAKP